jgi:hypothetical protein
MPQLLVVSGVITGIAFLGSGAIKLLGSAVEDVGESADHLGSGILKAALGAGAIYFVWNKVKK